MPRFDDLKLKFGDVITPSWYDKLVNHLDYLDKSSGEDVYYNITPVTDLQLNLGLPLRRWREVHAGYGYFTYAISVGDLFLKHWDIKETPDLLIFKRKRNGREFKIGV